MSWFSLSWRNLHIERYRSGCRNVSPLYKLGCKMKGIAQGIIMSALIYIVPPIPKSDFSMLDNLDHIIKSEAKVYKDDGLTYEHMRATFVQESNFNGEAVSRTGALGCAQLMPETIKALGLTKEQAKNCKTSMQHAFAWMKGGTKEIKSKDPFKLSQWYYCGINYYGKVIDDKDFKVREICGTSYARKIIEKMNEIKKTNKA